MKRRAGFLILALLFSPGLLQADNQAGNQSGMSLGFGLAHVQMGSLSYTAQGYASATPLAFTPVELGYRWKNGFLFKMEIELFYYVAESRELLEKKTTTTDSGGTPITNISFVQGNRLLTHEYSATNFALAGTYDIQLPFAVRPYVGTSFEFISSSRRARSARTWDPIAKDWGPTTRIIGEKSEKSWGITGSSAIVGLRWILNKDWSLHAEMRHLFPYSGEIPSLSTYGLGVKYLL